MRGLPIKKLVLVYNRRLPSACSAAEELAVVAKRAGREVVVVPAADPAALSQAVQETELAVSLGGDGTILRTARAAAPCRVPILGINCGELGFLAELTPAEALEKLPEFLEGMGWVEERATLDAYLQLSATGAPGEDAEASEAAAASLLAVNDIVVGRGQFARVVRLKTFIGGAYLTTYTADGVVVATPTGSTAYSLAAGGPILDPRLPSFILTPLLPHLMVHNSLVLPPTEEVRFEVHTLAEAILSVDGQIDYVVRDGDSVTVRGGRYSALFVRSRPRSYFYETLFQRLRQANDGQTPR